MKIKFPTVAWKDRDGETIETFRDFVVERSVLEENWFGESLTVDGEARDCVRAFLKDGTQFFVLLDIDTFNSVIEGHDLTVAKVNCWSEFVDFEPDYFTLN